MNQEKPIRLQSGPWSLEFEPWSGWVRCILLNGTEVVRAIYSVVRDENWATFPQRVTSFHITHGSSNYELTWSVEVEGPGFVWEGRASLNEDALEIVWIGISARSFRARRTGMCLLHPQELRGVSCRVVHSNGKVETGSFPQYIEPSQIFSEIQEIEYQVDNLNLSIGFQGEVFEMEDQRNWTDASFKTYCRPQAWPQPFQVTCNDKIRHAVRLSFDGIPVECNPPSDIVLTVGDSAIARPKIGTLSKEFDDDFDFVIAPGKPENWNQAGLGKLYVHGNQFVDLNCKRPDMSKWDGVAFPATPQVHALDERSIMENVHGLRDAVLSARKIASEKVVAVGPIRFRAECQGRDSRIDREIGPAWFLASILVLADAGAHAVCILEASDYKGAIRQALKLIMSETSIRLFRSSDPYRVMGFELKGSGSVLLNLQSQPTLTHFKEDVELGPYEIRLID